MVYHNLPIEKREPLLYFSKTLPLGAQPLRASPQYSLYYMLTVRHSVSLSFTLRRAWPSLAGNKLSVKIRRCVLRRWLRHNTVRRPCPDMHQTTSHEYYEPYYWTKMRENVSVSTCLGVKACIVPINLRYDFLQPIAVINLFIIPTDLNLFNPNEPRKIIWLSGMN